MKRKSIPVIALLFITTILKAQPGWYVVPNAPTSPRYEDVSLVGNTAWIAENDNVAGIIIHKSSDKGDTWFACDTLPGTDSTQFYIRSVEFLSDSIGLIGTLSLLQGTPILFRTIDGGNTFTPVSSPAFNNADGICGMAHYGSTFIGVGIYDSQANFFKSTDAGVTWSISNLSNLAQGLVDCFMVNDSTYLISGHGLLSQQNSAVIFRTTNGGATWQQVALDTDPFGYCWKMNFTANGKGVASIQGTDHIFISQNFGVTWSIQTVGNCSFNFGGTAFLNDTLGWVGDQYAMPCFYATTDGGTQWTQYTFGNSIDRMVVLDSQSVMAVGQTIYKFSFDSILSTNIFTPNVAKEIHLLKVNPNPVAGTLNIEVQLDAPTLCSIFLLDEKQNLVKQIERRQRTTGKFVLQEEVSKLPSGNYILYMTTYQRHVAAKFEVAH